MITLSLCMIVKDEEDVLARCLSCIKDIADEIIIADTGSSDKTKEIAASFTQNIYDFPWCDDFAKARNFSFSKATMDYVMWLDADDILTEENQRLLLSLKQNLSSDTDMVMMKYDVAFDEQGNPTFSYYRERIFKRAMDFRWAGAIHEVISPQGKVLHTDITVCHKKIKENEKARNLKIFEKMIEKGETLDPRQQYYYGRELYYNGRCEEASEILSAFLSEKKGWIENNIGACRDMSACFSSMGLTDKALESLFKSFAFDRPRAEICCDIGRHFMLQSRYEPAIFWYETAAACRPKEMNGGFYLPDCYGYIPYLQLCVCHDRMGNIKKAREYNEMAGAIKPDDKAYLYNKKYFESL